MSVHRRPSPAGSGSGQSRCQRRAQRRGPRRERSRRVLSMQSRFRSRGSCRVSNSPCLHDPPGAQHHYYLRCLCARQPRQPACTSRTREPRLSTPPVHAAASTHVMYMFWSTARTPPSLQRRRASSTSSDHASLYGICRPGTLHVAVGGPGLCNGRERQWRSR